MADENLVNSARDMLKEETWTRSTIGNYTENDLQKLSDMVERARQTGSADEIRAICDEQRAKSKDSIAALYMSGMLSLSRDSLDNSALIDLVELFQKNRKDNIVEKICQSMLDIDPNSKFALRSLADCRRAEGRDDVWPLYEKIVKLDFEEADLAKALGAHYEESDKDTAVEYYKKALLRYIAAKNWNALKEIWTKLIQLVPQEIDFFMLAKRKVAKTISAPRSATLMQELYNWYKDNKEWDVAIDILKQILEVDVNDKSARRELIECYRGKYSDRDNIEDYIRAADLSMNSRNVFESISSFEKHIAFGVKSYVYHRSWGVGVIVRVKDDTLFINFGKGGKRSVALKMAVRVLTPLPVDHIWVIKATQMRDELAKKVKGDKVWALKTIIKSFGNSCDLKRIKAELVPSILTPGEWTAWHSAAKQILENDSSFGVDPNNVANYTVREHDASRDTKLSNEFKAQKQFFARIDIMMKYMDSEEADTSSDLFGEMFSYFTSFLKSLDKVNAQTVGAFLAARKVSLKCPDIAFARKFTFKDLYDKIENPREMYLLLKDTKNTSLRSDFLECVKTLPDWDAQYARLFPVALDGSIVSSLLDAGKEDSLKKLARDCFESWKDNRQAVVYFFRECREAQWFKDEGIPYDKQLIALINIINLTFREIDNHLNTTENKKVNKAATNLLFGKDEVLARYMLDGGEETSSRMYTLVNDIANIDPSYKVQLRNKILEKFPDFKFPVAKEKARAQQQQGMLVTARKLEQKRARADEIQNKEIPENAREIGEARAQGDLKENAEYKAAKEKQHFLNNELSQLQDEIGKAIVFDPTTLTTAVVSFGTEVTLHNSQTNQDETRVILGPWESDPDNGVISYMSGLGRALMDKKPGETASSTKERDFSYYTVKEIKAAKM